MRTSIRTCWPAVRYEDRGRESAIEIPRRRAEDLPIRKALDGSADRLKKVGTQVRSTFVVPTRCVVEFE